MGKALILLVGIAVGAEILRRLTAAAEIEPEADAASAPPGPGGRDEAPR